MSLAEQLQAQQAKLKKIDSGPPASKPASQMTLAEQLQAQAAKLKKVDGNPPPVSKPES